MTISSNTPMMPPVNNISKDIISQNDTDSDSALSLEELGIDEEVFNSLDADSDGLLTQSEIASAIDSKLSELDTIPTRDEFASLLSDLGLEMPEPPEKPDSSTFANELISSYDTDGDSLLSSDEVSILSDEEFSALDTDGDGSISAEELSSAIDQVASASTPPPPPPPGGSLDSSSDEDSEYYSSLDTNEDGVVSEEELEAAGVVTSTEDSSTVANTSSEEIIESLQLMFESIKLNSEDSDTELNLNDFKNIMKMINTQNNSFELNSYVGNISSNSNSRFSYA